MNLLNSILSGRRVLFLSAAFLLIGSVSVSCKKKSSKLGKGALTVEDLLKSGAVDTFQLYTYSEVDETYTTDNTTYGLVGAYNDPKTGNVSASLYTQIYPTGALSLQSSDVITVDSVILSLEYLGYYGKVQATSFEVYRLDDTLDINTNYYKQDSKPHLGGDLVVPGTGTVTPKPSKYYSLGATDSLKPQLRLKLNNSLGETILQDARTNTTLFNNNSDFVLTYFKGLHIKSTDENPAAGNGAVYFFNTAASQTKITIYYKVSGETSPFTYDLNISSTGCADFNHIEINNSADVQNVIDNPTTNSMETFYAQSHKIYGVVDMPSLKNLSKKSVIHQAYISLPIAYNPITPYYPSTNIFVGYKGTDGIVRALTSVVGTYDVSTGGYLIDVHDFAQAVTLGNADYTKLYFYPVRMRSATERIIFNGPNTTNKYKPKLIVKYTSY